MNTLLVVIVIIVIVFLLTYDPKTRRLEKYLTSPGQAAKMAAAAASPPLRASTTCEADRYYSLQFNAPSDGKGCSGQPKVFNGAVI